MISLEDLVAEAADPEIQESLFRVLADHLALECDTRPGVVVVLDGEALKDPAGMLTYLRERCGCSGN
jgi:hypothetical protein